MGDGANTRGQAEPEFVKRVGDRVRGLRRQRGWTVRELAEASGVSRRMLTQIELGQANPSLATVDRIASALDTDFPALARPVPEVDDPRWQDASTRVWRDEHGSEAVLLGATRHGAELWWWKLAPGARYEAQADRAGTQEILHVLSGKITVATAGGDQDFSEDQTAVIDTDHSYTYLNGGEVMAIFNRVVSGA